VARPFGYGIHDALSEAIAEPTGAGESERDFHVSAVLRQLRTAWGISEGAVFDQSYLEKYIENNRALLPPNFTSIFVEVVRDCRGSTVEVRLPIDQLDPRSQITPKNVDCDPKDERSH
jgi:hypothetical protein